MKSDPPRTPAALTVSAAEAGMKLLRFLERRLGPGQARSVLYKWIRTGQVRVNKGRAGAHDALAEGDTVRIPPFAQARTVAQSGPGPDAASGQDTASGRDMTSGQDTASGREHCQAPGVSPHTSPDVSPNILSDASSDLGPGLSLLATAADVLILNKASGLASQPGRGDSVAARLQQAYRHSAFVPAPAHRLDRHTSGLMLAGLSHRAQQRLHALIKEGGLAKEYLAWACGRVTYAQPCLLRDTLFLSREGARELIAARPGKAADFPLASKGAALPDLAALAQASEGRGESPALCALTVVGHLPPDKLPGALSDLLSGSLAGASSGSPTGRPCAAFPPALRQGATLLLIRLLTGRKHQIRVQLASRGHPLVGDGRYGGPRYARMLLHAFALTFAAPDAAPGDAPLAFVAPPDWPAPFMPEPLALAAARERLQKALALYYF